jgi:hypothetical protein
MLIERVFAIGGLLCLAAGAWLAVETAIYGLVYFGWAEGAALFVGFGIFFLYVGRGARRQRRSLLELGEKGVVPERSSGPPRR